MFGGRNGRARFLRRQGAATKIARMNRVIASSLLALSFAFTSAKAGTWSVEGRVVAGLGIAAIAQRMSQSRRVELVRIVHSEIKRGERLLETSIIDVQ